jgi:hemerythrin
MLIWTEQFATGFPVIDEQHRQLIRHVNKLEAMLVTTNPTVEQVAYVAQFIDFLEDYIRSHFEFEEQCMQCNRCPVYGKNREAHERFRETFHRFKEKSRQHGFRMELLTELNNSINIWIQDHILRIDTQMKPFAPKAT